GAQILDEGWAAIGPVAMDDVEVDLGPDGRGLFELEIIRAIAGARRHPDEGAIARVGAARDQPQPPVVGARPWGALAEAYGGPDMGRTRQRRARRIHGREDEQQVVPVHTQPVALVGIQ